MLFWKNKTEHLGKWNSSKSGFRDFPGSPVVKMPCSQCRVCGFHPWLGNWDLVCHLAKKKKKKLVSARLNCICSERFFSLHHGFVAKQIAGIYVSLRSTMSCCMLTFRVLSDSFYRNSTRTSLRQKWMLGMNLKTRTAFRALRNWNLWTADTNTAL